MVVVIWAITLVPWFGDRIMEVLGFWLEFGLRYVLENMGIGLNVNIGNACHFLLKN